MPKKSFYFPRPKKLLASLRLRSREYLRENTLHGFPYFVNPRRPRWERIVWFIATMASIGAAIGIIYTIYETFQAEPTLTGLETETEELTTYFPGLMLCPMYPNFTRNDSHPADSKHYTSMYHWHMNEIVDFPHDPTTADRFYSQFYRDFLPDCGDLFVNCEINGRKTLCQDFFHKRVTMRGVCCISDTSPITKEEGMRKLTFDVADEKTYPISLDLLDRGEIPSRRKAAVTYMLKTGVVLMISIQVTTSSSGVCSLPRRQRKCQTPDDRPPSHHMCLHECISKKLIKKCGCVPWFMAIVPGTLECKLPSYPCMSHNVNFSAVMDCRCYLSCNHTCYHVESVQLINENRVTVEAPNWPSVTYRRELRFGWLDLLASFGGIAGLFVGYSLLTSVELAYYLVLRTYCGAVISGPEDEVRIKSRKPPKAPKRRVIQVIDLKKEYHNYVE